MASMTGTTGVLLLDMEVDPFSAVPWAVCGVFWAVLVFLAPDLVSDVHAVTIVALSALSLGGAVSEVPRHVYTTSYFGVTFFQMCYRQDWLKVVHHAISIFGMYVGLTERGGHWMDVRLGSRIMLIEVSTPLLHAYKRTGLKALGMAFAVSFVALRCVYLGYLVATVWAPESTMWRFLALTWGLNQIWTVEIIQKFAGPKRKEKEVKGH
jgi:hypothetical protein